MRLQCEMRPKEMWYDSVRWRIEVFDERCRTRDGRVRKKRMNNDDDRWLKNEMGDGSMR